MRVSIAPAHSLSKNSKVAPFTTPSLALQVEGVFYVNQNLEKLMLDELRNACRPGMIGGFLPGVKQIANVAALPGIVGNSVGLPDVHSGYGFAIGEKKRLHYPREHPSDTGYKLTLLAGNMAAFDINDPESVVSPGGVGFDINCGVRLLRTNLFLKDVIDIKVRKYFRIPENSPRAGRPTKKDSRGKTG